MAERKMKQNVKDAKVKTYMYWMMGLLVVLIGIAVLLPIIPADAPIWLGKVVTVTLMLLTEVILVMAYKLARYYYQGFSIRMRLFLYRKQSVLALQLILIIA